MSITRKCSGRPGTSISSPSPSARVRSGNRLARGPEYRHAVARDERRNAADVVVVMMSRENRRQREPLAIEVLEHGLRIARIDDDRVAALAQASRCSCPRKRGWG
jgi:hypothetical protein